MHSVPEPLWWYGAPDDLSFIGTSSLRRHRFQCSCLCQASCHTYTYFKFLKILLISHLWHLFSFSPFPISLSILDYPLTIMSVMFQAEVKIFPSVLPSTNVDSTNVRPVIMFISNYHSFNPTHNCVRLILFHILSSYRWKHWTSERKSDFLKVIKLESQRVEI